MMNKAKCPCCRKHYPSRVGAEACCMFEPKVPLGWCAWCGKDCSTIFCCRPCQVEYQRDVVAEQAKTRRVAA